HHPDAPLELVTGSEAQHAQGPAGGSEQAREHGDGGALSRAVLAEEAVEAALRDAQVDSIHGELRAEAARQRVRLDGKLKPRRDGCAFGAPIGFLHAAADFLPGPTG